MGYTGYYEDNYMISYAEYEQIRKEIALSGQGQKTEELTVRKLKFETTEAGEQEADKLPVYCICMKNQDIKDIYLEKRRVEDGVIYKTYARLSYKECEKIIFGDIEWMKKSKKLLLKDLYYQITINGLKQERIEEYKREIVQRKENEYLVFNKRIQVTKAEKEKFLQERLSMIDCLAWDEVFVSSRCEIRIPLAVTNILHTGQRYSNTLAFSM